MTKFEIKSNANLLPLEYFKKDKTIVIDNTPFPYGGSFEWFTIAFKYTY